MSTEEQRERHTIATQRQAAERYLRQHQGVRIQWYEDNGVSGMIPLADRPVGKQLLHDAQEGAWLGDIVPYGYRVVGKQKDARLRISDEPIEGCNYSGADVVRLIYHMTVEEQKSCFAIAVHLNALGVPPVYARDQRTILRGKRRCRTSGSWMPGRIRNMIVNTTYKGIHYYGRRSKKQREVIARAVPAIVDEKTWEQAQEVLHAHQLFGKRNAKRQYLLRGLIKCGHCGLTYIGTGYNVRSCPYYYVCSGRHNRYLLQARGE